MFTKYARAIDDTKERKTMRGIFISMYVFLALFIVSALFTFLVVLIIAKSDQTGIGEAIADAMFLIAFIVFQGGVFLINALVLISLSLAFTIKFTAICKRPQTPKETPAVYSYRTKLYEYTRETNKKTGWAKVLLFISAVVFGWMLAKELLSENSDMLYFAIGGVVLLVGACTYFLACFFRNVNDSIDGKTFAMRVEDDARVIDELQGRVHKQVPAADKNLQGLAFRYPDEDMRKQVVRCSKTGIKIAVATTAVSMILLAVFALLEHFVFKSGCLGYLFPAWFAFAFVAPKLCGLGNILKEKRLNAKQKEQLRTDGKEKNLRIIELYERYSKKTYTILYILIALSVVIGFVLAALFPTQPYSIFPMLISYIWVFVNMRLVKTLRANAAPIEREIEAEQATQNETAENAGN